MKKNFSKEGNSKQGEKENVRRELPCGNSGKNEYLAFWGAGRMGVPDWGERWGEGRAIGGVTSKPGACAGDGFRKGTGKGKGYESVGGRLWG